MAAESISFLSHHSFFFVLVRALYQSVELKLRFAMATFHPVETNYGTVTTWVPLTTQLPSEKACFSAIYSQQFDTGPGDLVAFDPFYATIDSSFTTECIPPEATEWWNQPLSATSLVTSLGPLTCPQAYTTVFAVSAGIGSTKIGCCPSGYAFQGNSIDYYTVGQCASPLTPGQKYTFLAYPSSDGPWLTSTTSAGPSGSSVLGVQINGWDFGAAAAPSTTTSSSSSSSTKTSTPSPTDSAAVSTSSTAVSVSKSSGGLSAGASAGIGVGVTALIFGALGLLAFIIFARRRRRQELQQGINEPLQEMDNNSQQHSAWRQSKTTSEMPTQTEPVELSTRKGPYELG